MGATHPVKKLLVTGASGFLGWNICRIAGTSYEVIGVSHSKPAALEGIRRETCDLTRLGDLRALFDRTAPDAVIHAAAVAGPNICQEHPAETGPINVDAPLAIAGLCSDRHIPLAFTSTDLVFDGTAAPYSEERQVSPISIYGEQKVRAEQGIRSRLGDARICRMPLMYGDAVPPAQSFIHPFITALLERKELMLFYDEYRTPQSAVNAAQAILCTLDHDPGTYHCGGRESISRFDFCLKLAQALAIGNPAVKPVRQKEMASIAPRPLNVSLDSSKLCALGFNPGTIYEELDKLECVKQGRNQHR